METYFTYLAMPRNDTVTHDEPAFSFDMLYNGEIPEEPQTITSEETVTQFYTVHTDTARIKKTPFIRNQMRVLEKCIETHFETLRNWQTNNPEDVLDAHYTHFNILKHNGGLRPIDAPDDWLMNWLREIKNDLQNGASILPHNAAHAYVRGRSNLTAVQKHQQNGSHWKLHMDFSNFFGSVNHTWACEMLKRVYPFSALDEEHWNSFKEILKLGFLRNGETLPQGTPLSPYITNLIMVPIDYKITKALIELGKQNETVFIYTRYADDMTISCRKPFDYQAIVQMVVEKTQELNTPIHVNNDKTKYGSTAGRNWELGLMWNQHNKITLGSKKVRLIKQEIYNFCKHKREVITCKLDAQELLGRIEYFKHIEPEYASHILNTYSDKYNNGVQIRDELRQFIRELH